MKIRQGFVSNSSSSSFVIKKEDLTDQQISSLLNYHEKIEDLKDYLINNGFWWKEVFMKLGILSGDGWDIVDNIDEICGSTIMDNGDIDGFLEIIGVRENIGRWERE